MPTHLPVGASQGVRPTGSRLCLFGRTGLPPELGHACRGRGAGGACARNLRAPRKVAKGDRRGGSRRNGWGAVGPLRPPRSRSLLKAVARPEGVGASAESVSGPALGHLGRAVRTEELCPGGGDLISSPLQPVCGRCLGGGRPALTAQRLLSTSSFPSSPLTGLSASWLLSLSRCTR